MRNIWILVKNYILCSLGSVLGKKKARGMSGIAIAVFLFLGLGAIMAFQGVSFGLLIQDAGGTDFSLLLYMGLMVGFVITLFFSMQNITGGSRANDADLLLSMPLSKVEIAAAKALSKYLIYFAMNILFSAGFLISYLAFSGFTLGVAASCLLIVVLIPLLAVGLNYILDYLTTVLFGKSGLASIFRTIFAMIIICAFLGIWMYIQLGLNPAIGSASMLIFPPISWMMDVAISFKLMSLLWLLLITVLPFILGIVLMATTLDKHNTAAKRKSVEIGDQKNRSPLMNMFLKELKVYLNLPVLMINTLVGVIMIIALTGWLVVDKGKAVIGFVASMGLPAAGSTAFAVTLLFCLLSALVFSSCSSISLEGKSLWVIKTMPINPAAVLVGKALINIMLVTPVIIISSTLLFIVLQLTFLEFLMLMMLPIFVNIFISFGGLFINLLYPKFDWESEQSVVKQSVAAMITSLLGIIVGLVPIILAVIFGLEDMAFICIASSVLLFLLAIGSIILTLTKGKTLYENL